MDSLNDTIAAIATPPGDGGVGILRLSGPDSVRLVAKFFRPFSGQTFESCPARLLVAGSWTGGDGLVEDNLLCVRFAAPASYTGQETAEVHAHGGGFHLRSLLQALLQAGARLARPGEFTQRAFLNGKMDLTQAEAVADLISSRAALSRQAAARQLEGGLQRRVEALRKKVLDLSAQVEASVDFPDEQDQLLPREELARSVAEAQRAVQDLLSGARTGRLLRQGAKVVLCGRPNVGKSSILNALLGTARAIVHDLPGTTRDFLEEPFQIEGFPLVLVDTAGLRLADDAVEREGVERSRRAVHQADVVLLVLDAAEGFMREDREILEELGGLASQEAPKMVLLNKSDLSNRSDWSDPALKDFLLLRVSARTGQGLDLLKKNIFEKVTVGRPAADLGEALVTRERHESALRRAEASLAQAAGTLEQRRLGSEFLSGDLRDCLDSLGEIVGATTRQDVLSAIFSKFCIGK
jgi:tRNA modification GTPase